MEFAIVAVIFLLVFGFYAIIVKEETGDWPGFWFFFGKDD